ncbi:MAG: IPT/TIG domain-containing protein [Chryseolinea sp.]
MKMSRRYSQRLARLLVIVSLLSSGCSDDDSVPAAEFITVDPVAAPKGATLTLAGSGFGIDTAKVSVTINNKPAKLSSLSNSIIKVIVPDKAGSGKIVVSVRGTSLSNQPAFTYKLSVSTVAGDGTFGTQDGSPAVANFTYPTSLIIAPDNKIYVTETQGPSIRVIAPDGYVSTLTGKYTYGYKDGPLAVAAFSSPFDLVMDQEKNIYVTDFYNFSIRKIGVDGMVSTLAGSLAEGSTDGTGAAAKFSNPAGLAIDKSGILYVADRGNHRIRKITPAGVVTTLAGSTIGFADGQGTAAKFNEPAGLTVDANGNVYVSDYKNNSIRKITPDGLVSTLAGTGVQGYADGKGSESKFYNPLGMTLASDGTLYVADSRNSSIRAISSDGNVSTFAGKGEGFIDGAIDDARFKMPTDVVFSSDGTMYVVDQYNTRVRKID